MATPSELRACILDLFDCDKLGRFRDEWGLQFVGDRDIERIGYATNLTPEVAKDAVAQDVDLVLTHHDAWPFLTGMRERCDAILQPPGISSCFVHAPLDDADFGTSASLCRLLGLRAVERCALYRDEFLCGRVAETDGPTDLESISEGLQAVLDEPVRTWRNNERPVGRVCATTGGGHTTDLLEEAVERACDLYITGEKVLYTVEYARFAGLSLIVGSHSGTELPGVASLAGQLADSLHVETVRLRDPHGE